MPCFVFNPDSSHFSKATNHGAPACALVRVQVGPFGVVPRRQFGPRERSRPHAPCPSITGDEEEEEGEEEEAGGRGGGRGPRLKLKGEALASASGQASRCGDPGLFELK